MEERLRSILNEVGGLTVDAETLGPTDSLFAKGLTSFSTVTVMLALEEEFDVSFPDALLTRETFTSIASLSDALRGLQV